MKIRRPGDRSIAILLALFILLAHASSPNVTSTDSVWAIHTAMSIIREGNTNLDEYRDLIAQTPDRDYAVEEIDGHLYTPYPLGASLIAVPGVFVLDQLSALVSPMRFSDYLKQVRAEQVELFLASLVVALTALVLYYLARRFLNRPGAILLVLIFAFCTSAWSTASRALWQHGPSIFMLSLALYLVVYALDHPRAIQWVSLPLAFSYVIRPTNSLSILVFTVYVLVCYRRYFLRYLLWSLLVAVPFLLFNLSVYHAPLSNYYRSYQEFNLGSGFLEALLGLWVSPARGLLVYSPIFLFAAWGLKLNLKSGPARRIDLALLAIVTLHCLVMALWRLWWGGWGYGPRMMTDLLPYFMYWLIPVVAVLQRSTLPAASSISPTPRRRWIILAFGLLAGISLLIQYRGATDRQTFDWNRLPANVDRFPQRLWDVRDLQFLRGIPWGVPTNLAISGVAEEYLGSEVYSRLGTAELRTRHFNADRALTLPSTSTWLILGKNQPIDPELAPLLGDLRLELEGQALEDGTPFRLYSGELGAHLLDAVTQTQQTVMWSSQLLPDATDAHTITLPVRFGDVADLLGVRIQPDLQSDQVTVVTYWRAGKQATAPLSLFIHAIDSQEQLVAQEDRLDTSVEDWRPGDWIVQVNHLTLPPHAGSVWFELGLYHPDTGERLPVIVGEQVVDRRVLLKQINFP